MKLIEFLQHQVTNLPVVQVGTAFRKDILEKFTAYEAMFNKIEDLEQYGILKGLTAQSLRDQNDILRKGILKTIDLYYQGEPSSAYNQLCKTMDDSGIRRFLDKGKAFERGTNFFRIRMMPGNYPLEKKQLFHIPFQERGLVNTQRYSIPGLPSLYVANSIYVAWEEMGRPGFENNQAVRLHSNESFNYLDLTTDHYNAYHLQKDNISQEQMLFKAFAWPLVAACSVKVKDRKAAFKPEYIISQLLLQWINKTHLHGIKYSSTHIDQQHNTHKGTFFNVVIPVRTYHLDNGYCPELINMFLSTQVFPMQLGQFNSTNDRFHHQATIRSDVNLAIEEIEIVKNAPQPYSRTAFGILEHYLADLDLEEIAPS
jgi:hypothetical protein